MPATKTHTARRATMALLQTDLLLERTGLTADDWKMLLFETGCRYVEKLHADQPDYAAQVLQDPAHGFWAGWMQSWLEDDAIILRQEHLLNRASYAELKEDFVTALNY